MTAAEGWSAGIVWKRLRFPTGTLDLCISNNILVFMASERRFSVVKKMLEEKGYALVRCSKSSHFMFSKPGAPRPVVIVVHHNKVKPEYIQMIKKLP